MLEDNSAKKISTHERFPSHGTQTRGNTACSEPRLVLSGGPGGQAARRGGGHEVIWSHGTPGLPAELIALDD